MRIAVMGTGGYFGGRLARAGETVAFMARGERLAALCARGLTVTSVSGDYHDLVRGRRPPLEALHGPAARLGVRHQIPTAGGFAVHAALRPAAPLAERVA